MPFSRHSHELYKTGIDLVDSFRFATIAAAERRFFRERRSTLIGHCAFQTLQHTSIFYVQLQDKHKQFATLGTYKII